MYRPSLLIALLCLSASPSKGAQPQPSHAADQTQCQFQDRSDVTVEYTSMQRNGRKIFGGLVPYGKLWNMGSERPPTFVTSVNLLIDGKEISAGHYSLSAIPGLDKWTLILMKTPGKDSPNGAEEVARFDLLVRHLLPAVDNFAIKFDQMRDACVLNLRWEETEASVLLAEKK